jgi:hypothetical protein
MTWPRCAVLHDNENDPGQLGVEGSHRYPVRVVLRHLHAVPTRLRVTCTLTGLTKGSDS